jgi:DNA repair protein RecN (Recombination protein N)
MLKWQTEEIEAAKLKESEEELLQRQIVLLTNTEKISGSVGGAWSYLSDGGRQGKSVIGMLQECRRNLESAVRFDDFFSAYVQEISGIVVQLEDMAPGLRDYLDQLEFDPVKLGKLQERMDLIYRLKQKYGTSLSEVIAYGSNAKKELADLERHDEILKELRQHLSQLELELEIKANKLNENRTKSAGLMSSAIEGHLQDLGMPGGHFSVLVSDAEGYSSSGRDNVRFEFSANPGEELRLLSKVASGGELSRVALAIKTVCARNDGAHVMVFDEIDSGVGGQTARKVATKIGQVASQKQVLCITHLPQIASMADCHIHIEKKVIENRTQTFVRSLPAEERLVELARMIGGDPITKAGLENATEMVQTASELKAATIKEKHKYHDK